MMKSFSFASLGDINGSAAEAVARDLGADAVALISDASSEDGWAAVVKEAVRWFGGLDILVNNAAVAGDASARTLADTDSAFLGKSASAIFQNQVNDDCKITLTDRGFVLQAVMRAVLSGQEISAPYCLIAEVKDGKVIRGYEYFDTAQLPKRAEAPGEGMISF